MKDDDLEALEELQAAARRARMPSRYRRGGLRLSIEPMPDEMDGDEDDEDED